MVRSTIALWLLCLSACVGPGVLVAPDGQHRMVAADGKAGVRVVLTTGVWSGEPPSLAQDVTVVHVLIANLGSRPLRIAPGDFDLRDARGIPFALLDTGASFEVLDQGSPDTGMYDRSLQRDYDPGRRDNFESVLAAGDMARLALPWGVLEPGTQIRGYLYFDPITARTNEARLTWHLATPDDADVVRLVFPFAVARS